MDTLTNLIASVGFPIVMCLLMYKYITNEAKQTREAIQALTVSVSAIQKSIDSFYSFQKGVIEHNEN